MDYTYPSVFFSYFLFFLFLFLCSFQYYKYQEELNKVWGR